MKVAVYVMRAQAIALLLLSSAQQAEAIRLESAADLEESAMVESSETNFA